LLGRPPTFKYRPLSISTDQIRLLRIPPKKPGISTRGLVAYGLFHDSLRSSSEYVALSYCWGDSNLANEITIDGKSTRVTESVAVALENLQRDYEETIVWIHQVCINQQDAIEKTAQVQLMERIYSSAGQVIIWLGPSTPRIDCTMQEIRKLGSRLLDMGMWNLTSVEAASYELDEPADSAASRTKRKAVELANEHLTKWLNGGYPFWWIMSDLGKRAWFKRIWCIQKCANAKTALLGIRRQTLGGRGNSPKTLLYIANVVDSSYERIGASDPRDRVYALLGIANDHAAKKLIPNYSLSCEDAYTMPWSVWDEKRLFEVSNKCSRYGDSLSMVAAGERTFSRVTTLRGVLVDSIEEVGQTWELGIDDAFDYEAARQYFSDTSLYLSRSVRYDITERAEAEWRLLISNTCLTGLVVCQVSRAPPNSHIKAGYHSLRRKTNGDEDDEPTHQDTQSWTSYE
ncbi:heterokaryon incompatibility protein-domain-containing protein, partial [Massariosphaeria phaeospora]